MTTPHETDPLPALARFGLTLDDVRRHELQPAFAGVDLRKPLPVELPQARIGLSRFFGFLYRLNVDRLGRELHDLLSPCVIGYALQLRQSGRPVLTREWRWARTFRDGIKGWTVDTPMHIASVSKLITAMALTKLLDDKGISHDARIEPWLPRYWPRGSNVANIRFRHLMTHRSGLFAAAWKDEAGPLDFLSMKAAIADGTTDLVKPDYKNINFSLCRVLVATLNGDLNPAFMDVPPTPENAPVLAARDAIWDAITIRAYQTYVNDRIFAPAGLAARDFEPTEDGALAYKVTPDVDHGWNSGNHRTRSGAIGWRLSARALVRVLGTFRRGGKVMTETRAQAMLDKGFGLGSDFSEETIIGWTYGMGGVWSDDDKTRPPEKGQMEQSNAFLLPRRMELVILANSPFCTRGAVFMPQVFATIKNCIEPWWAPLFTAFGGRVTPGP